MFLLHGVVAAVRHPHRSPGLGCQDLVARTWLPGLNCPDLVARIWLLELNCRDLVARTWLQDLVHIGSKNCAAKFQD